MRFGLAVALLAACPAWAQSPAPVSHGLVATGTMPAALRDRFGETFGSGSGMAIERETWRREGDTYSGSLLLLPDRGYNVEGTSDYRPRVNRIAIRMTPRASGTEAGGTLQASLADTILLTDEAGTPMTGLDPEGARPAAGAFPALPLARNGHVSLDPEAIVRLADRSWLVSDEYGPYIYHFAPDGRMISATAPPAAVLPMRKGAVSFSSNNPGPGAAAPSPKNPETGRQNNQGLEGMALDPATGRLTVVLQSALRQDGGDDPSTRRHARALVYDAADPDRLRLVAEHVVPLPVFTDAKGRTRVAAQSEALSLGAGRFLLLSRDGNVGQGMEEATSRYRRIDILDLDGATDIAGTPYDALTPVAPKGVLAAGVAPARLTPFIDINKAADLARFGLHNGEPNDAANLSEKWEAMGLVPAADPAAPDDWFLFVANDNDFRTRDGFQAGAPYRDEAGAEIDTRFLVYRVTLPGYRAGP